MAQYIPAFKGYMADVPEAWFKRCDNKVFHFDKITETTVDSNVDFTPVSAGWGLYPKAYIPAGGDMTISMTSAQFDADLFAMANATNYNKKSGAEEQCTYTANSVNVYKIIQQNGKDSLRIAVVPQNLYKLPFDQNSTPRFDGVTLLDNDGKLIINGTYTGTGRTYYPSPVSGTEALAYGIELPGGDYVIEGLSQDVLDNGHVFYEVSFLDPKTGEKKMPSIEINGTGRKAVGFDEYTVIYVRLVVDPGFSPPSGSGLHLPVGIYRSDNVPVSWVNSKHFKEISSSWSYMDENGYISGGAYQEPAASKYNTGCYWLTDTDMDNYVFNQLEIENLYNITVRPTGEGYHLFICWTEKSDSDPDTTYYTEEVKVSNGSMTGALSKSLNKIVKDSVSINGLTYKESGELAEGEFTVKETDDKMLIEMYSSIPAEEKAALGTGQLGVMQLGLGKGFETYEVSYELTTGKKDKSLSITNRDSAIGSLVLKWPVYARGTDCTQSAIMGFFVLNVPKCRVTQAPGFDTSYKSASVNSVTWRAMDPKDGTKTKFHYLYMKNN